MRWLVGAGSWALALSLVVPCASAGESASGQGILRIDLQASPIEGIELPEVVTLVVELRGETEHRIETKVRLSEVTPISLPQDPSSTQGISAEVRIDAPGFWAPASPLFLIERETTTRIRLHPTGELRGQVIAEEATVPETLAVHFRAAPGSEENPLDSEHSNECPIEDGRLRCNVPAGSLDLRFRAHGFVSAHRWGLELPPHETRNVGRLVLRRGASVVGWVLASDEEFQPESASVELIPKIALESRQYETREREEGFRYQTRPNGRGFFQLAGLPPGAYYAIVRHPGFAPSRMEPILVREGLELQLPEIRLEPPLTVTLTIQPPRDPFNKPWKLVLRRQGLMLGTWPEVAEGALDAEGRFQAEDLEPGLYRLKVTDSRGSQWHHGDLEVQAGSLEHEIVLPWERLEARVTLAGEPLDATVYFGGRNGAERVVARTRDEGTLYVFLPVRDSWIADVESPALHILSRVEGIEVEKEPDEPWAKTEIEVPDTRLLGEVVDEMDRPLAEAYVDVYGPGKGPTRTVFSKPDGRFEIRGFPPGTWSAEAHHRPRSAGPVRHAPLQEIEVEEGEAAGPLRLVARPQHRLTGQVVAPNGDGIPGTMVVSILEQGLSRVSRDIGQKTTEVDGSFELWIPDGVPAVQIQVFPPGYAAQQLRVTLPRTEPVMVLADPVAGTIVVEPEDPEDLEDGTLLTKTALFGDYLYATPALRLWAGVYGIRERPDRLVVPSMPPGPYTACFGIVDRVIGTGRLPLGVESRCSEGFLAPGGELVLKVPVGSKKPEAPAVSSAP